jgi:hypothetical protein
MPNQADDNGMPRWATADAARVAQLDTKVSSLDSDVKQINIRIDGVYKKIDTVAADQSRDMANFAHEMRAGMEVLSTKFTDKSTPKFGVIFAGLAVAATIAGMIGGLALSPLQSEIALLKHEIVPRTEHDYRNTEYVERFQRVENGLRRVEDAMLQQRQHRIDELTIENRMLRSGK